MGNPAVDLAITGLETIGVPIPPSMASLVELLLNDGLDVLTEVPRIVGIIEGLGGSAFHVLEEVASGMAASGPVGYVQHQVDIYTAPYISKAQEIKHGKQRLTDLHRANLQSAKNQLTALYSQNPGTGPVTSYSGPAADTMMASFNTALTQTDNLLTAMDQSQQIDADLQTDLENIVKTIIVMVIIDLIVFAIVFIVVFVGVALGLLVPAVALAPETGGLSLPADPALAGTAAFAAATTITGGLVGAEVVGVFALFLYAFGRWAVRHMMLAQTTTILQASKTGPVAVPNPDSLPPDVRKRLEAEGFNTAQLAAAAILYAKGITDVNQLIATIKGLNAEQLTTVQAYGQNPNLTAEDILNLVLHTHKYEPNPKHGKIQQGVANPAPTDGQGALNNAVSINPDTTTRLIGVDPATGEIVIFDETYNNSGIYHGHVRSWKELTPAMQNVLRKKGLIDAQGKIISRDASGKEIGKGKNVIKGK